jgi:hypothetical protein
MAYTQVKEATAEKEAADMRFQAKLKLAEGDAAAAGKRAEGEKAIKMVDVNVERERVGVEQARVDVERQSLSNKQEFEEAALKFELEKFRINAEREIRIAAAQAMSNMFARANMQIFGDPATMANMSAQFMRAAGAGAAVDGLLKTLPDEGKLMLDKIGSAVLSQLAPKDVTPSAGNGLGSPVSTDRAVAEAAPAPAPAPKPAPEAAKDRVTRKS